MPYRSARTARDSADASGLCVIMHALWFVSR